MSIFNRKRILVTGASGFVGTNLVMKLLEYDCEIIGTFFNNPPSIENKKIKYLKCNLTNELDCLRATENIDYVIMCAANSSGAEVIEKEPLTHLTPNIIMNSLMLAAAYKNNVKKFIFISSNTVYPLTDFPVTENDVNYQFFEKYHIVGWMKLFSEKMCAMYSEVINEKMSTLIIRPANLFGPYDKYSKKESKVIAALVRRFAENENPLQVWGDGLDVKDFLYISDFIDALILGLEKNIIGIYNIASGTSITIKDIVETLKKITNKQDLEVFYDKTKPSMIPVRLISNKKFQDAVDWKPKYNLSTALKETYDWYVNQNIVELDK